MGCAESEFAIFNDGSKVDVCSGPARMYDRIDFRSCHGIGFYILEYENPITYLCALLDLRIGFIS